MVGSKHLFKRVDNRLRRVHKELPSRYLRKIPFEAFGIISFLVVLNVVVWAICLGVLSKHTDMYATAVLAWSLGLRHALDADHISAIDLMTRRLIASGQRPVTVGTFFSLGHSTIVVITSLVTAATAAHLTSHFDQFSSVGNIIGTAVSASFLIVLGIMNTWILYKLIQGLIGWTKGEGGEKGEELWEKRGGGPMWWILKKLFRLIDRPWKMYPLGVVFGLGFDTSSEIALLGLASLQASQGTSIWLILCFPILFTVGMCLIDTLDGAGMLVVYTWCDDSAEAEEAPFTKTEPQTAAGLEHIIHGEEEGLVKGKDLVDPNQDVERQDQLNTLNVASVPIQPKRQGNATLHNPLIFLYYSTLLTALTVLVALIIGTIQLLSLLQNVIKPEPEGRFWDGVTALSDHYDIVGGAIAGAFVLVGVCGVLAWPRFKQWISSKRSVHQDMLTSAEVSAEDPVPPIEPRSYD